MSDTAMTPQPSHKGVAAGLAAAILTLFALPRPAAANCGILFGEQEAARADAIAADGNGDIAGYILASYDHYLFNRLWLQCVS